MRTSDADRAQRTVTGQVTAAGAVFAGVGFTPVKTGTGTYTIRPIPSCKAMLGVMSTPLVAGTGYVSTSANTSGDSFQVQTYTTAGALADCSFSFSGIALPR